LVQMKILKFIVRLNKDVLHLNQPDGTSTCAVEYKFDLAWPPLVDEDVLDIALFQVVACGEPCLACPDDNRVVIAFVICWHLFSFVALGERSCKGPLENLAGNITDRIADWPDLPKLI
jgi:hypothetical protein